MKKRFAVLFFVILIVAMLPTNALAAGMQSQEENIIYFEDGSYIVVTLSEIETRASGTKTGQKTYNYLDGNGEVSWKAVITGTFTYTGSSATCTSSICDVTVYDTAWYVVSRTTGKSGNTATAEVTMGRKYLGITVTKKTLSLKITCDANGNLS